MDRGAWGVELLAVLAAWKLALPSSVLLLRGNHESTTCTKMYGFHAELQAKYGVKSASVCPGPSSVTCPMQSNMLRSSAKQQGASCLRSAF